MGVRILKRSYGNAFAPNSENKPDWLIGNVGDWIRLNIEVEAGVDYLANQESPVFLNKEERTIKIMNGKKWSDYGFDLGANIFFSYKVDTIVDEILDTDSFLINISIEQLFADTMVYKENLEMNNIPFDTLPTDRGNVKVYSVKFIDKRDIEGLKLKYANISNNESSLQNLNSFIDGTQTELSFAGLDKIKDTDGWQTMSKLGFQSGMSIYSGKVRKLETKGDLGVFYENSEVGNKFVTILRGDTRALSSLSVNKTGGSSSPIYKGTFSENYPPTVTIGTENRMFLYNSDFNGKILLKINLGTIIYNNFREGTNKKLKIILRKWNNGSFLNFKEEVILESYNVTDEIRGVQLNYNDFTEVEIAINESLSIDYSFEMESVLSKVTPFIEFKSNYGTVEITNTVSNVSYKKKYEIEIDFMLSSFFEQITDLENKKPPEVVFDANSLTDVIKLNFLPEWNNPNIKIENDMKETERLGNTGWFDENYNALPNNFKVKSIDYFDLGGKSVTTLSYGTEIKVKAVISGIKNLSTESDFKHGFIWLPKSEDQYKNKKTPFYENTKISSNFSSTAFNANTMYPFLYEGYSTDDAKMNTRAISYTIVNEDLIFEAIFSPTLQFLNFFENRVNDRKYAIWVSVADRTLKTAFSDRVSLLLDVNDMNYFVKIEGNLEGVTNYFLEHPQNNLETGTEFYEGFLEDDILARSFFGIEIGKKLNQVILGFEVENTLSGSTFELERYVVNTQQFITIPSGVQEIDFNSERGYKLEPNNNKNWVKIIRNSSGDGNGKSGYQILFAQKIRWEYWLKKSNVPSEYYDNDLSLKGNNNDWLHYLNKSDSHKINFFIIFDISENGLLKRYKNNFPITFKGYDENINVQTEHKYFDNETGNLLNVGFEQSTGRPLGVILSNKKTRIEITYIKLDGNWDIENIYGVIKIEIDRGAGVFSQYQLSSIWGSENDNILIPLPPNNKLLIEQIETNVIKVSCLVDYTKLEKAFMYKITGRIGCYLNNNGVPISLKKYDENNYELNYE